MNDEITIDAAKYKEYINRLNQDEPIEYITNKVSFYSRDFYIAQGALIPRPETEILIDQTSQIISKYKSVNIAEIGVGSGIISIILNLLHTNINKSVASDISADAINIAQTNINNYNLSKQIKLIQTNLLDDITDDFDVIVSNPPYIANNTNLENNLSFEPSDALFGGDNGAELLFKIIDLYHHSKAKYLICEMGYDQKTSISKYISKYPNLKIKFYKDLSDFDRGFVIEK